MFNFLRPDARATLWRWRDVIGAGIVILLGFWWLEVANGLVRWLGYMAILLGATWAYAGFQRALFRQGAGGPGIVSVIERKLAYFGPLTGGTFDLADITSLSLDPTAKPAHWIVTGPNLQTLEIPVNAAGADALFDAFATLPGIRTQKLLDAQTRTPDARIVIWQRNAHLLH